jgi:hypothetical protein
MAGPDKTVLNSTTGWTYYEYTFPVHALLKLVILQYGRG